jgi:hypothetical protein
MTRPFLGLATLAAVLLCSAAPLATAPADGEAFGYKFRTAPVDSMGVQGLPDLRGKPVLIDFWGTR